MTLLPRNMPLAAQMVLLTLSISVAIWLFLDAGQGRDLHALFVDELQGELERRAQIDRERFDAELQWVRHGARLITAYRNFPAYLESAEWREGLDADMVVREYRDPPAWMPPNSVLRVILRARTALLLDPDNRVREIYRSVVGDDAGEVPRTLAEPRSLLSKLSHSQAYLTRLDGLPYVIAMQQIEDDEGKVRATLILASPLDDEFLIGAIGVFERGHSIALVEPQSGRVVASSNPEGIPSGAQVGHLQRDYLMMGKSFFDYGSSDLDLMFASFIPVSQAERMSRAVLGESRQQRLLLVSLLAGAFLLLVVWVATRIRLLSREVVRFSRDTLGASPMAADHGDEVAVLQGQFRHLGESIVEYQRRLQREAESRLELMRRALEGEQHAHDTRQLQHLTEQLGIGILLWRGGVLQPFNPLMRTFVDGYDGTGAFQIPADQAEEVRRLTDSDGQLRVFRIARQELLGEEAFLVRDITREWLAEQERAIFATLPEKNPHPVLRIDRSGGVEYANEAAKPWTTQTGIRVGERLPAAWLEPLTRAMCDGALDQFDVQVDGRTLELSPTLIEGTEFIYLYGHDVTEERQADRQLRTAAAVSHHVLDAVFLIDRRGLVTQVNPAFTDLTGYTESEVVGLPPRLVHAGNQDAGFYRRLLQGLLRHSQWRGEIWNRRKNGELFPTYASISAIRDGRGRVLNFVVVLSDITERKAREEHLSRLAYHAPLTGLPNRQLLYDRIEQAIADADRSHVDVAVLFVDLDGFKQVNDTLGHDLGDQLLRQVAQRVQECVRASDSVGRLGGDEFVTVLRNIGGRDDVLSAVKKIGRKLSSPFALQGQEARISASIGVAFYPQDGSDPEILLKKADEAMYRAKRRGKNGYAFAAQASIRPLHG